MFQLNNSIGLDGKVSFSDISRFSGLSATDWSWGVQMVDFDLDGMNEIFVTNGIAKDLLDQDYIDFYNNPSSVRQIFRKKGEVIKEYFEGATEWNVELVDTGLDTMTGGRIKRIQNHIDDTFCLTYGDGLSDVNISDLVSFHKEKKSLATLTAN